MLAEAYKKSLAHWLTWVGLGAFLVWAVLAWMTVYMASVEYLFMGTVMVVMALFWTFVLVSLYHFVHAYLSSKDQARGP